MAITETTFGPKRYLTLKKSIAISQITDKQMYDDAGKKLGIYIKQNNLQVEGPWSVLYFTWDQANQKTDIGIGFPIAKLDAVNDADLSIVDIPQAKAAMDILNGPYDGLSKVHQGLMQYGGDKKYTGDGLPVMAIEEYVVDPMSDPNPANWKTNIYYLHN